METLELASDIANSARVLMALVFAAPIVASAVATIVRLMGR